MNLERLTVSVLGAQIDVVDWDMVIERLGKWSKLRESRYVCICNAHSVVTAARDARFASIVNAADMATADGAPVAWMLRRLGFVGQERINGPDLMWKYCDVAARQAEPIFLYGSSRETLALLHSRLVTAFPGLKIAGAISPPFRPLTQDEDAQDVVAINKSGAGIVFVSLGCPKQERWMAEHCGRIKAVMIGVGAAFDYHAGSVRRAPTWMRQAGLEWLYRLFSEPRRLWRRYLVTNTLFVFGAVHQLINHYKYTGRA